MDQNPAPTAAERLLDAASRLFYTRGVSNVGINEIIARAGVARMTLYHHFPSKDDLVKAVLEARQRERAAWLERAGAMATTPRLQILAVFDLLDEWFQAPDYRGCPLLAATFELGGQLNAARPYAQAHHAATRLYFRQRLEEAGLQPAEELALQLHLLLEGAAVVAVVQDGRQAARQARAAAERLLA